MLTNITRIADRRSTQTFIIGSFLAIGGFIATVVLGTIVPLCLGLSAYLVSCWPLLKRFGVVAFTGRYPE